MCERMNNLEKWENPSIIGEGVLPPHSNFCDEEKRTLDGVWSFRFFEQADGIDEKWPVTEQNPSDWSAIDVPCCWETRGYGKPWYFGANFPPAVSQEEDQIPRIDHCQTSVGLYQRSFDFPPEWAGRRIVLRFNSVKSAFYCWINGQYAGLGKGSMLPVEFDVTQLLQDGENTLCLQVYQFSDATYL